MTISKVTERGENFWIILDSDGVKHATRSAYLASLASRHCELKTPILIGSSAGWHYRDVYAIVPDGKEITHGLNETPLVIYHANCWDGFCAAWVARMALGDIEAKPAYYGASPPDVRGRDVYILDFSYPRETMRRILGSAHFVAVLDHHKTAEAALDGIVDEFIQRPDLIATDLAANPNGCELPFVRFDMGKSGGRLAWEYFAPIGGWLGMPSPWLVNYTEDRDLWRHALPDSENINAALRSYPLDFALWDEFHHMVGQREMFKREGAAIRRAEQAIVASHVRNAREREIDGHRVLAVNATVLFSEIAGELAKDRPFGACYFDRADGKRQWSLRSRENGIDVSTIAKAHGGGGHMQAAGYEESLS